MNKRQIKRVGGHGTNDEQRKRKNERHKNMKGRYKLGVHDELVAANDKVKRRGLATPSEADLSGSSTLSFSQRRRRP
jgi:hypothetical protein